MTGAPPERRDLAANPAAPSARAAPTKGDGWRNAGILLTATLGIAIAGIHFHIVSAMVVPLGNAYGWSRGEIAFALTIYAVINPFLTVWIGAMADRYGPRAIGLPGIVFFCIGLALIGLAGPALWTWYAAYIAFAIFGTGASSVIWTMSVVRAFSKRRGLALAVSLSGAGVLVSVMPSIVLGLERTVGLRGVYPSLAIAAFFLMFIPAWFFLPGRPDAALPALRPKRGDWREIVGSGKLWRLALGLLMVASTVGVFIVHFQPLLDDAGLSREEVAGVMLFVGPALVSGRIVTGLLFDLLPTRLVAATAFSLPGIACILLILLPLDVTTASFLAVLIGLGMGSEVDVVAYLSSRYFGLRSYGLVFGILISLYGLAVGTSSWLTGVVHDVLGSYDPVLLGLAAGVVIATILVISLGPPPPVEAEAGAAAH